jgi:hypothetical protein
MLPFVLSIVLKVYNGVAPNRFGSTGENTIDVEIRLASG